MFSVFVTQKIMKICNYPQIIIISLIHLLLPGTILELAAANDTDQNTIYGVFYQKGFGDEYGNKDQKFKIQLKNSYKSGISAGWNGKYDFGGEYEWLGYAKLNNSKILVIYNNGVGILESEVYETDFKLGEEDFHYTQNVNVKNGPVPEVKYSISLIVEEMFQGNEQKVARVKLTIH